MAVQQSNFIVGRNQVPTPSDAGQVCAVRATIALTANPTANDVLQMFDLPPNCVPDSIVLDSDDIDTNGTPTVAMSVGILNAAGTDLDTTASGGTAWLTTSNVGTTGAAATQDANGLKSISRVTATAASRLVGVMVTTASATFAAGTVGLTMRYRVAN